MVARRFTDEQEQEICRRYQAGETTIGLAKELKVFSSTIGKVLKRAGHQTRSQREAKKGLTEEQMHFAVKLYEAGKSQPECAKILQTSTSSITRALRILGLQGRTVKEQCSFSALKNGITAEQELKLCSLYQDGQSTVQLGKLFHICSSTAARILKRNGIDRRKGKITSEMEIEICNRYENGENTMELAKAFDLADVNIGKVLKANKIERRKAEAPFDSVQHALMSTGHFKVKRECQFYLYELIRFSETHCKPGIAFDADQRADEEYGEAVLRLYFATRQEAFFLEQAVLDLTRGSASYPFDLASWGGVSEVRAMPAADLEPIVLRLADELEELGLWEFAARYVPMTAAQRATCQQRAADPAFSCARG